MYRESQQSNKRPENSNNFHAQDFGYNYQAHNYNAADHAYQVLSNFSHASTENLNGHSGYNQDRNYGQPGIPYASTSAYPQAVDNLYGITHSSPVNAYNAQQWANPTQTSSYIIPGENAPGSWNSAPHASGTMTSSHTPLYSGLYAQQSGSGGNTSGTIPPQSNKPASSYVNVHATSQYGPAVPSPSTRVTLPSPSSVGTPTVATHGMAHVPQDPPSVHALGANPTINAMNGDMDPMLMQMGLHYGRQVLQRTEVKVSSSLLAPLASIRRYFRVDDHYVKQKLWYLIQPFRRIYTRQIGGLDNEDIVEKSYSLPIEDIAAPDLYIPTMALLTYVLISASSVKNSRNPTLLTGSALKILLYLFCEVSTIKVGSYLSQFPLRLPWLEALAICGYKLVHICLIAILSIFIPKTWWNVLVLVNLWGTMASTYFFFKTLAQYSMRRHRITYSAAPFLYIASILQAALYYWYTWGAINTTFSLLPIDESAKIG